MNHLNKTTTIKIDPRFSWVEWELYDEVDEAASTGAVAAAESLNALLRACVNAGYDRDGVQAAMEYELQRFAAHGATDTAVREFLESVLDEIFGD